MTNAEILAQDPGLRAAVCATAARALEAPADWPPAFDEMLRSVFTPFDPSLRNPADALADAVADVTTDAAALAITVRHTRIFIGPAYPMVTPVASAWRPVDPLAPTALLEDCGAAYAEAGLDLTTGVMPVDHVVVELEFLHYLAWQEAGAEDAGTAALWHDRQHRFWTRHMAPWLSEMAEALAVKAAQDAVYSHSGALLLSLCRGLDTVFPARVAV